ncbi:MAG: NifU family protein [Armatimonadetes bacterium]|nr:NifU family protein [Armatimonadota bacterium]
MTEQTKDDLRQRVQAALEQVRPNLQRDGGDVELLDVVDGVARVRLQGACHGCPMAAMTLQMGVERVLKSQVPELKGVENVPDEE